MEAVKSSALCQLSRVAEEAASKPALQVQAGADHVAAVRVALVTNRRRVSLWIRISKVSLGKEFLKNRPKKRVTGKIRDGGSNRQITDYARHN